LPRVAEDACGEGSEDDLFARDAEHRHGNIMLILHVLQIGILLIVGKSNA
jgi:hypothetical protein